jgi:predicted ATP-grasp superfamily ATP-dependent carboligase
MKAAARNGRDGSNGGERRPAAFVLGSGQNGLGVYRSLGRRGIPVTAVHPDAREVALASRYCRAAVSPPVEHAQAYTRFLMELARGSGGPQVLIPTSDPTVVFISENRETLAERFRFVLPGRDVVSGLIDKREFDRLARAHGLPVPRTIFAGTAEDIRRLAPEVPYPAVLKPAYSPAWMSPEFQARFGRGAGGYVKRVVVASPAELVTLYEEVRVFHPDVVVQELIEGGDDHLVDVYVYLGPEGEVLGLFAIQKVRVLPIDGNGVGTCVRAIRAPELAEASVRFLRSVGYRGNAAVCFKRHARDGRFYAIEVNARLALHHALATACGVDLPYVGYRDALGRPPAAPGAPRGRKTWLCLRDDLQAALRYRKQGRLSLGSWLRSLAGPTRFVYWTWDDPRPALVRLLRTCAWWRRLERAPWTTVRRGLLALSDCLVPSALSAGRREAASGRDAGLGGLRKA